MSTVKTENWITIEEVTIGHWGDTKVLPAGSYVKPIEHQWVPKWCFEKPGAEFYNRNVDVFCYTQLGIYPIERKKLVVR
jgi:hypothetical protein